MDYFYSTVGDTDDTESIVLTPVRRSNRKRTFTKSNITPCQTPTVNIMVGDTESSSKPAKMTDIEDSTDFKSINRCESIPLTSSSENEFSGDSLEGEQNNRRKSSRVPRSVQKINCARRRSVSESGILSFIHICFFKCFI